MPGQPRIATLCALALAAVLAATVALVAQTPRAAGLVLVAATPPVPVDAPTVAFIGDSWTVGRGATVRRGELQGYAVRTAARLGWHARILGVGGSGYSVPGPHREVFAERIERAVTPAPDVIVVQGSLNERKSTPQALARAATATLAALRAEADPATRIVVVGAGDNPGTPPATIDWINRAIRHAADAAALEFVDPSARGWIDPHDGSLWADTIHPDDLGYQRFADRLTAVLRGSAAT